MRRTSQERGTHSKAGRENAVSDNSKLKAIGKVQEDSRGDDGASVDGWGGGGDGGRSQSERTVDEGRGDLQRVALEAAVAQGAA